MSVFEQSQLSRDHAKSESESDDQREDQSRDIAKSESESESRCEYHLEDDFQVKTRSQARSGADQLFLQLCLLQILCNEQGSGDAASGVSPASTATSVVTIRKKERRARAQMGLDTQELKARMHSRGMGSAHGRLNGMTKICQPRARGGPKA